MPSLHSSYISRQIRSPRGAPSNRWYELFSLKIPSSFTILSNNIGYFQNTRVKRSPSCCNSCVYFSEQNMWVDIYECISTELERQAVLYCIHYFIVYQIALKIKWCGLNEIFLTLILKTNRFHYFNFNFLITTIVRGYKPLQMVLFILYLFVNNLTLGY